MNVHQSVAVNQPLRRTQILPADTRASMVRFEGISKIYPAYRDKPYKPCGTSTLPSRTNTAVIGRTGACKSSLMQLINGVNKLGVPLDVAVGIRVACEEGTRVLLKTGRNAEGGLATAALFAGPERNLKRAPSSACALVIRRPQPRQFH